MSDDKDQKIQELIDVLRNTEDFNRLAFPTSWYKKYNIPSVKPMSFKEYLDSGYWFAKHFDKDVQREIRTEPVEGGVRPVLPAPEIPVEIVTKPVDQTDDESQQQKHQTSEDSTGSNDSTPPLS